MQAIYTRNDNIIRHEEKNDDNTTNSLFLVVYNFSYKLSKKLVTATLGIHGALPRYYYFFNQSINQLIGMQSKYSE